MTTDQTVLDYLVYIRNNADAVHRMFTTGSVAKSVYPIQGRDPESIRKALLWILNNNARINLAIIEAVLTMPEDKLPKASDPVWRAN